MHRLVQAVIRQQLHDDRQQATAERVVTLLAAASPGDPENPTSQAGYVELAPHVLLTGPSGDPRPEGRRLILNTARYLQAIGDSQVTRVVAEQLLRRWRPMLGPDHPDTLTAASILALVLVGLGEPEPARALGQDTLQRARQVLGPDHVIVLSVAAALPHASRINTSCMVESAPPPSVLAERPRQGSGGLDAGLRHGAA